MEDIDKRYAAKILRIDRAKAPQGYITEVLKALDYPSVAGTCYGYSFLAIQAFLAKDFASFEARLERLTESRAEIFSYTDTHSSSSHSYFGDNENMNDLKIFFDNLMLVQRPFHYSDVFGKRRDQDNLKDIIPFVESKKIEDRRGLVLTEAITGIYDEERLESFVTALDDTAQATTQDLAFQIAGHVHAISILYDANDKKWRVIDANNPQITSELFSADKLSKILFAVFNGLIPSKRNSKLNCIALRLQPITVGEDIQQMQSFLQALKEHASYQLVREINPKTARMATSDGVTWAHHAAEYEPELLSKLVANGADLDRMDGGAMTPKVNAEVIEWTKDHSDAVFSPASLDIIAYKELLGGRIDKSIINVPDDFVFRLSYFYKLLPKHLQPKFLEKFSEGTFASMIRAADDLDLLTLIPADKAHAFMTKLSDDKLTALVTNSNDLITILKFLPEDRKKLFLEKLGDKKLFSIISNLRDATGIMKLLNREQSIEFVSKIVDISVLPSFDSSSTILYIGDPTVSGIRGRFQVLLDMLINLPPSSPMPQVHDYYHISEFYSNLNSAKNDPDPKQQLTYFENAYLSMNQADKIDYLQKMDSTHFIFKVMANVRNVNIQSFLLSLNDREKNILFEKFDKKVLDNLFNDPNAFLILELAPPEQRLRLLESIDLTKRKYFGNTPVLEKIFILLTKDDVKLFLEKMDSASIVALMRSSHEAPGIIELLPDDKQGSFLDELYLALKKSRLNDDISLQPILAERELELANVADKQIISELRKVMQFANSRSSNQPGRSPAFFSPDSDVNQKQIAETVKVLDKTDNLIDAIRIVTELLKAEQVSSEPVNRFSSALVRQLSGSGGLLSLADEELKTFRSDNRRTDSIENTDPALSLVSKEQLNDAIIRLEHLATVFTPEPTSPQISY
jgi:hypothetical protein